jgi:hypothetical protein
MFYVADNLEGSRYLYLPLCGWAALLGSLLVDGRRRWRWLGLSGAAVIVATWSLGLVAHVTVWHEASALRDRVLASAAARYRTSPCLTLRFDEVPDSVDGAYVFRNGFREALASQEGNWERALKGGPVPAGCTFRWQLDGFR